MIPASIPEQPPPDYVPSERGLRDELAATCEGIAADDNLSERERLVSDPSTRHCLILCNHGLFTVSASVAEAFCRMYYLDQACRIQIAVQLSGMQISVPPEAVVARTASQFTGENDKGWLPWQALRRKLNREQPDHRF